MQGEKEISLTGFLSCTIDLMEMAGGNGGWAEGGMWDKDGKGRQLMHL